MGTRTAKASGGFTLIELMVSMAALMMILGMLYGAAFAMAKAAGTQDSLIMLNQEARVAMDSAVRNLRMSPANGVLGWDGTAFSPLGNAPVTAIQYRRVADMDGNGVAVNQDLSLGLTPPFQLTRDLNDANQDGLTNTQLVRLDQNGNVVEVLANHLSPPMATGGFYTAPNGGFEVRNVGGGSIQITLIMRHRPDPASPMMVVRLDEVVSPRN